MVHLEEEGCPQRDKISNIDEESRRHFPKFSCQKFFHALLFGSRAQETLSSCYCTKRMLKAITTQHTATYGLFRSPWGGEDKTKQSRHN